MFGDRSCLRQIEIFDIKSHLWGWISDDSSFFALQDSYRPSIWKRENKNTHKTLNIEQSIGIVTLLFCLWISLMNIKVSKSIKYTPIQFSRGQNLFPLTYNSLFTSHVFDRRWIRYLLIEILFYWDLEADNRFILEWNRVYSILIVACSIQCQQHTAHSFCYTIHVHVISTEFCDHAAIRENKNREGWTS